MLFSDIGFDTVYDTVGYASVASKSKKKALYLT